MKLYEIPRGTWIKVEGLNSNQPFYFWNVDGMYSRCSLDETGDSYFHIVAWAEAEVVDGKAN